MKKLIFAACLATTPLWANEAIDRSRHILQDRYTLHHRYASAPVAGYQLSASMPWPDKQPYFYMGMVRNYHSGKIAGEFEAKSGGIIYLHGQPYAVGAYALRKAKEAIPLLMEESLFKQSLSRSYGLYRNTTVDIHQVADGPHFEQPTAVFEMPRLTIDTSGYYAHAKGVPQAGILAVFNDTGTELRWNWVDLSKPLYMPRDRELLLPGLPVQTTLIDDKGEFAIDGIGRFRIEAIIPATEKHKTLIAITPLDWVDKYLVGP